MSATQFSLYILRCSDGSLYTGIAADVEKRLAEHESGTRGAKFLRGKGPFEILLAEPVGDRAMASRLEYRVKQLPRAQKFELIDGSRALDDLLPDQVLGAGGS